MVMVVMVQFEVMVKDFCFVRILVFWMVKARLVGFPAEPTSS